MTYVAIIILCVVGAIYPVVLGRTLLAIIDRDQVSSSTGCWLCLIAGCLIAASAVAVVGASA